MANFEFGPNLEQKSRELRESFIQAAQVFLIDGEINVDINKMSDRELGEYIQVKFQEHLNNFFETSGLAEDIKACISDDDALHLIAQRGEGIHGWVDMLPNLIKSKNGAGMNCTMSSAMLHLALEKLGLGNIRTVAVKGHHVVLRELEDGSLKLYDASSKSTVDGKLVGYSQTFEPEQISNRAEIEERGSRKGFRLTLDRGRQDDWGGFHLPDDEGRFKKNFYAYDPSIKMDISIALGNLSEIKDDAKELGGVKDLPLVDSGSYLEAVANFIRRNSEGELTEEVVRIVGRDNPEAANQLLERAERSLSAGETIPNPFDFIKSEFIHPKKDFESSPDPSAYVGEARLRHDQAKELVAKHPFLNMLNADKIVERFSLFSVGRYVEET